MLDPLLSSRGCGVRCAGFLPTRRARCHTDNEIVDLQTSMSGRIAGNDNPVLAVHDVLSAGYERNSHSWRHTSKEFSLLNFVLCTLSQR